MRKVIFFLTSYFFLHSSFFSQTHFTVPENVWRVNLRQSVAAGNYIGPNGKKGIPNMPFSLANYGKRYIDHSYVVDGFYASDNDLHNLDTLGYNSNYTIGQYIRYYNSVYGDSIPDLSVDFFETDSIALTGTIDQEIKKTVWGVNMSIEYGLSDRMTIQMKIPYYTYVSQNRANSFSANEIKGLDDFVLYHSNARAAMDSALNNNYDVNLQIIRDRFYSWAGDNSVLWAMSGNPFSNGIYGAEYNPFSLNDTTAVTMNDLLNYYYPSKMTTSGLGDVELGLKFLLFGKPAWSEKGVFSFYAGISVLFAAADRLHIYNYSNGIAKNQSHFTKLPLGDGVSKYNISLFGELYRTVLNRKININWFVEAGIYGQTRLNTPISFVNYSTLIPDSIANTVGVKHTLEKGNDLYALAQGKLELIPDWVSITGGASFYIKGRDTFYSNDQKWDKWMSYRKNEYDTRIIAIRQFAEVILHNVNPLKRIGSVPFELRGGYSVPLFSRNTFSNFSAWIQLVVYAQAW